MLPGGDNQLSTISYVSAFVAPNDSSSKELLRDQEMGGVAVNDASAGLLVKPWVAEADAETGSITLSADGVEAQEILVVPGIEEISLAFDQNMQPVLAYQTAEGSYFWWFDPTITEYVTIELASGSVSPRCTLDDKRQASGIDSGLSDILLAYMRDGALYIRQQRDRFDTEYLLASEVGADRLGHVGMNEFYRLQIELVTDHPVAGAAMRIVELDALNSSFPEWSYLGAKAGYLAYPSLGDEHEQPLFESYAHDPRDPKAFFVAPITDDEDAEVLVTYSELAPHLESTEDELGVGDEYVNAIEDYVVYRALARDGRNVAASDAQQARWVSFVNALGLQSQGLQRMADMRRRALRG